MDDKHDDMKVSINGGPPTWMVYHGKSYSNDLKWMIWMYPHKLETTINTYETW